mmetsp:Transcript_43463/g.80893  ORF Transcript_43463/g.80893 Transcript_43463/m.80893 type:complete len:366 (+) Transcript_43463:1651-2748(+)
MTADVKHPRVGREVLGRVLCGDAALDRHAPRNNVVLDESQILQARSTGDEDRLLDDVDVRHLLRHGVLDLDPRVDLHEVMLTVLVDKELDGPRVLVVTGSSQFQSVFLDGLTDVHGMMPSRGDFHELLIPSLDGAVALPKVHDVSLPVADDLDLDVLSVANVPLDEARAVAEGGQSLRGRRPEERDEIFLLGAHSHALPSSALGRLDHDGQAVLLHERQGLALLRDASVGSRHDRHSALDRQFLRLGLVAEDLEVFDVRAAECDAGVLARLRERSRFGQEAVPRVDGVDPVFLGDLYDGGDVQVRADGSAVFGKEEGLIGVPAVGRVTIFLAIDGHGAQVQFGGGAEDADSDLAAVGRHDLLKAA